MVENLSGEQQRQHWRGLTPEVILQSSRKKGAF